MSSYTMRRAWAVVLALAVQGGTYAQETKPADVKPAEVAAVQPAADAAALKVIIKSVTGLVQVRKAEGEAWQPAKVDMELGAGAEFRTGPKSSVTFVIPPDQTVTLDRLGTMKVLQAIQQSGKITTDLGMKYGRTHYQIEHASQEHETTIRSPSSTLAVRGSDVVYQDDAFLAYAQGKGKLQFISDLQRKKMSFGSNVTARVTNDRPSAANVALAGATVDTRSAIRTEDEAALSESEPGVGGEDLRESRRRRDRTLELARQTIIGTATVPGPLDFQLSWFASGIANLDLIVTDPRGNVVSSTSTPAGKQPYQGEHYGDDQGTSGSGIETVSFPFFFRFGNYKVNVVHRGEPGKSADASLQLSVLQGPNVVEIKNLGNLGGGAGEIKLTPGQSFVTNVAPSVKQAVIDTAPVQNQSQQSLRSRKR